MFLWASIRFPALVPHKNAVRHARGDAEFIP
ncbi:MAG: hypothetical protein J0L55_07700 [Caulobacterales bacterium]|nr:hypothetical protein [Caulobacterales bacterium]